MVVVIMENWVEYPAFIYAAGLCSNPGMGEAEMMYHLSVVQFLRYWILF